jgi:hypothetical protein
MRWSEELCRHVAVSCSISEAFGDHDASRPTKLRVDAKGLKAWQASALFGACHL